jgi:hypothetical protein
MAAPYEPPISDDRGALIVRPSWGAIGWWQLPISGILGLVLLAGSLKLFGRSDKMTAVAVAFGLGGLFLVLYPAYLAAYALGTRITVTADAILVTHWFWSTSRVAARDIVRVVRCSVQPFPAGKGPHYPAPAVFAFSGSGRCVLSLDSERWRQADLDRIWRHLRVVPEGSWDDVIRDEDLSARFPGAF